MSVKHGKGEWECPRPAQSIPRKRVRVFFYERKVLHATAKKFHAI